MEIRIVVVVSVLVFLGSVQSFSEINRDVTEPDMIRNKYLRMEKALWDVVSNPVKNQNDRLNSILMDHNNFVNTFLMNRLDFDDLKMLINSNGWHKLHAEIINVHRLFVSFRQHLSRESKNADRVGFNEEATLDLTEHVLNDPHWPLHEAVENLHKVTVDHRLYLADVMSGLDKCTLRRSDQQIIYQLYNALTIVQLEAYMMTQCSFMLLSAYQKGDYASNANTMRTDFMGKTVSSLIASHQIFEATSRSVLRCDPQTYQANDTYLEITRLLQGQIENEIDLNRERSCTDTCSNYQFVEDGTFGCSERSVCNKQTKCKGKLLNCRTTVDDMWVCPGNKNSVRRYEYITFDDGRVWGEEKPCNGQGFALEQYWWKNVLWHCDHCFCICDEQGKLSDRFFSLRQAVSDIGNNMIVTGVRFVKINRIIHLQIKESELQKYGAVNASSTQWVPPNKFTTLDKGIRDGIDYHTLEFDQREVDLDDLTAPAGHVVTGLKFRRLGHHLNLEMRVSEINFSTGQVESEKSFWLSSDNTENSIGKAKRSEIRLTWPHVPTKTRKPSLPMSKPNSFIKFTHSDIGKDAAQNTVPFLDSQEVSAEPAMPLQGVGLYFKSQSGYGGFIAPKIETLDYGSYIRANLQNFKTANDL